MPARSYAFLYIGVAVLACPAVAQSSPEGPTAELYACAGIADDTERLACFDGAVAALRTAEEAGDVQAVNRAELKAIERDAFGFSLPNLPQLFRNNADKDDEIQEVSIGVDRISPDGSGALVFYLSDGQVWRQIDSKRVPKSKIRRAEAVTIKRASLGSYKLVIDGTGAGIKVRREN